MSRRRRIQWSLMFRAGRKFYELQWRDPVTGRKRTKSTKESSRRDAERFAARHIAGLESGEPEPMDTAWASLEHAFQTEKFPGYRKKTRQKIQGTFNLIRNVINPKMAESIDEVQIAKLTKHLRGLEDSEFTVRGHLANVRNILNWAVRTKRIAFAPHVEMPPEPPESNRGRPITREEFERMLKVTPKVVGQERGKGWRECLEGLWLSGLRLTEALTLHWTDQSFLSIDLSGTHPMLRIQAAGEKGKTFRLMPLTPDFATWLLQQFPEKKRKGFVFNPETPKTGDRPAEDTAIGIICEIGRMAKVKVGATVKKGKVRIKYASAHDLRRAFGLRWSLKVRAPVLMALMRHDDIATTMKFYAHVEAQAAAEDLWRNEHAQAKTNTLANSRPSEPSADQG